MPAAETYDAIVIGAGQSGGPLSTALAKAGWQTALIEREHVGGTCVNEGCTPTKTMVASARVAHLARRAADYGVQTGPVSVDMAKVRQRKRAIVDMFRDGSQGHIEKTEGVDLLFGEARFTGTKTLELHMNDGSVHHLTADQIFINTGARPNYPPLDGLGEVSHLSSTSIMELDQVPDHLLVIGGGYVGLEFGQMFRRFGSAVTLIQRSDQLLPREDRDVADEIADIFREDGIEVLLETEAQQATQTDPHQIELVVKTPSGERSLTGSHLLIATGRAPNTDYLNPQAAGLEMDKRGHIQVNEKLETNVPGIYAMGDVTGGPAFTHISYDDFRILTTNLLEDGHASISDRLVPYTVFIDPQLGRVGLSEKEAKAQGRSFCVAKMPMNRAARALEVDETRGFMKALVEDGTDQILGVAILGIDGGEIMGVLQVAMMGRLPYTALRNGIFAHPTLTEALNNLFMTVPKEESTTCHYPNR